jgi:N-acyl-L-homoserine lactone synthetase
MFDEHYEVVVADTPSARRIHHQIRYQVYCVEQGYEDPAHFPDGEERDEWDAYSIHFLVRDRSSGDWIGAMRLVRPAHGVLPIQLAAQLNSESIPMRSRHDAWELSRTCILSHRRRGGSPDARMSRLAGTHTGWPVANPWIPRSRLGRRINWAAMARIRSAHLTAIDAKRNASGDHAITPRARVSAPSPGASLRVNGYEILAGMLRAAIEYTRDHDVHHLYFLINRALARMVRRMEFDIIQIGTGVEHRGTRYPYAANLNELVHGAVTRSREMAKLFLEGEHPYRYHSATLRQPALSMRRADAAA